MRKRFSSAQRTLGAKALLAIFGVIWSAFTLFGDWILVRNLAQETIAACTFQPVGATISKSEVVVPQGAESDQRDARVEYTYRVAGQDFAGTRYAFGDMSTNGRRARRIVSEYRAGDLVTAFYNPGRPSESTLTI